MFQDGAVLVFLPGWTDISKVHDTLRKNPFFSSGMLHKVSEIMSSKSSVPFYYVLLYALRIDLTTFDTGLHGYTIWRFFEVSVQRKLRKMKIFNDYLRWSVINHTE